MMENDDQERNQGMHIQQECRQISTTTSSIENLPSAHRDVNDIPTERGIICLYGDKIRRKQMLKIIPLIISYSILLNTLFSFYTISGQEKSTQIDKSSWSRQSLNDADNRNFNHSKSNESQDAVLVHEDTDIEETEMGRTMYSQSIDPTIHIPFKVSIDSNETNNKLNHETQKDSATLPLNGMLLSDNDILDELQSSMADAIQEFERTREAQYGEYTDTAFKKENLMPHFKSQSEESIRRLRMRLKIKILQSKLLHESVNFTWIIGGHSTAAGHGNLLSQSYAAVIERLLQPFFLHFDINMMAKNYAMGGTTSGPEVAMCFNAIFGMDIDAITWDYGLLDGRNFEKYALFAQRVGAHPTKPSLFTLRSHCKQFDTMNAAAEESGLAIFHLEDILNIVHDSFPDTDSFQDIDLLPPGIRYFVCNGHIEAQEPCHMSHGGSSPKWDTQEQCPDNPVGHQVKWHSGWKSHMFTGFILASFLVENLNDAILELREEVSEGKENSSQVFSREYLDRLIAIEEQDKDLFKSSVLPQHFFTDEIKEFGLENYGVFMRSNVFCHTALLPSQSRYDGLVTESGIVASYEGAGRTSYIDEGYHVNNFPEPTYDDRIHPWLTYDPSKRNVCEHAEIDFKDYFVIRNEDSWMSMTVPNDAENVAFSIGENDEKKGYVMVCTKHYDFKAYPDDYIFLQSLFEDVSEENHYVEVNGIIVTESLTLETHCNILRNRDGYRFPQTQNDSGERNGRYDIKIRIPQKRGILYISSVIVL